MLTIRSLRPSYIEPAPVPRLVATYVPRGRGVWTRPMMERLRSLWLAGIPVNGIACELEVSRDAVMSKAHRLGLPRRPDPVKER